VDLSLFKLHVDWLGGAREAVGLPVLSADSGGAPPGWPENLHNATGLHLQQLSGMASAALQLVRKILHVTRHTYMMSCTV